jgi:hypothetical protein
MHPQFPGEAAINPFDLWEGANFKLKIRQVEGYRNYDKSEFDKPESLADDAKLEQIWKQCYSLQELVDLKHFKSYDELKMRLEKALGNLPQQSEKSFMDEDDRPMQAAAPMQREAPAKEAPKANTPWDDEDDEDLSFFKKLANN